ncbi:helix-turn-helix transcriptional regulator [Salmonella enterica]|uniref:Helix-turn-helix transcriptional regulator n=2 Tax=Salmonella enterica TaxID=28901 RepID=A0A764KRX0_SALER|nr:helix-turn-helix transcriptional regulator [Salmonella enterica]EAC0927890.1 helix-turn-helix transcriptional regulator [Salmonella enterica subsp. enterica serovar Lisboa]EBU7539102.1 helix-turn-helix transcriptional regulator [Salmonella enterica subsp. salamae serovar Sofia]EBV4106686.1 helix-turn-helix transcriptional regulator [Salmonella enterica subsp. enterica serovar Glostrup]EBV4492394.1 helix-turn-helix transcriptional regulator [Salmonella enterica subsp. enterica serovar Newport
MQESTLKTLADRLNYAMHEMGMSQGQLAKAAGMAQPTIWRITSGNARGTTKIVELANALGVRSEWLSNGTGPMRGDGQQPTSPIANKKDSAIFRVDVLDLTVSAGPGIINSEFVEVLRSVEYSVEDAHQMFNGRKQEQIRIINVRGDSMSGTIEPGDLLFIDISIQHFDGDGIYAFLYDDTAHVKRLQKMKDKLLVISDNKSYSAWDPIERDEMNRVFVFGKVIGSMPQTYRKHG